MIFLFYALRFMSKVFLSVVIPAFNEESNLVPTLNSVFDYLKKQDYSWEVIVVNDGSKDHTKDLVLAFQKSSLKLVLLDFPENHGKGFAVNQGVLRSRGELVLFMDADNSTKINEIEKAIPLLQGNIASATFDVVIGSRRLPGSKILKPQPMIRRLLGEVFRFYAKFLFGFSFDDTQAGFKVFNQKAKKIFSFQTIWRWGFDVELLWLAKKMKFKLKEIPIDWENSPKTHVSLFGAANMLLELLKIRLTRYNL